MKVLVTKRADRSVRRIADYWFRHGASPLVFMHEYLAAIDLLETTPGPGKPVPSRAHPQAKRILLTKSRCHVYFEVDQRRQVIHVLQVWDGRRGRPPKL